MEPRKWTVIVIAFLCAISWRTANARDTVYLTDNQLKKVTAGGEVSQFPSGSSLLSNYNSGVNQFSPAVATLIPTITTINLCVICINPR